MTKKDQISSNVVLVAMQQLAARGKFNLPASQILKFVNLPRTPEEHIKVGELRVALQELQSSKQIIVDEDVKPQLYQLATPPGHQPAPSPEVEDDDDDENLFADLPGTEGGQATAEPPKVEPTAAEKPRILNDDKKELPKDFGYHSIRLHLIRIVLRRKELEDEAASNGCDFDFDRNALEVEARASDAKFRQRIAVFETALTKAGLMQNFEVCMELAKVIGKASDENLLAVCQGDEGVMRQIKDMEASDFLLDNDIEEVRGLLAGIKPLKASPAGKTERPKKLLPKIFSKPPVSPAAEETPAAIASPTAAPPGVAASEEPKPAVVAAPIVVLDPDLEKLVAEAPTAAPATPLQPNQSNWPGVIVKTLMALCVVVLIIGGIYIVPQLTSSDETPTKSSDEMSPEIKAMLEKANQLEQKPSE